MDIQFVSRQKLTPAEFAAFVEKGIPADGFRYELIRGHVVMEPPAGYEHGRLGARLVHLIHQALGERDLGVVFDSSAGFELPTGDTLEPDAAFVSRARLARVPDQDPRRFIRAVPDLVVEIASPSTRARDATEKKRIYRESGVEEYLLVDPENRTVTCFRFGSEASSGEILRGPDIYRSQVVPDFELTIDRLFG
ncbi:MAG: Uma2 family endonuclease [Planctomycetota bacterium]